MDNDQATKEIEHAEKALEERRKIGEDIWEYHTHIIRLKDYVRSNNVINFAKEKQKRNNNNENS